ncbi:MAG: penicillin-binding protein 2 [Acidobacteriota bacterium]|jgi:penicillin-binding protein 2
MELQQETNKQLVQQRMNLFCYPVLLIFLILGARLWQLQIIQGAEYALKAENNRVRRVELIAPRGMISDRNHKVLAEHRSSFTVLLYRESITDPAATVRFLAEKLGINSEDVESKLRRSRETGMYRPIVVEEEAGIEDISIIEAHRRDHPEIQLVPEPLRSYKYDETGVPLAAHLLGYIGEVTEEELDGELFPSADYGSLVGQSGIERKYNELLVGQNGERLVLVDSRGREVGLLDDENKPITGGEVQLTLDLDLQKVAAKALEDKVGAIVAMDPGNGEILAMASAPSFDPNAFSTRLSYKDWNALLEDPDRPLQNRCIQNSYAPGSIFKLIMAEAGLESGLLDKNTFVDCEGTVEYYGRVFHCIENGHGRIGLENAIARSCNIFFYELGRRLGISRIADHAAIMGLGQKTGIDLPGERSGIVPSPEWKKRTQEERWYLGETIPVSIGQGALSTTPLQVLRAVSAFANGGFLVTPHLLYSAEKSEGNPEWPPKQIGVSESSLSRIREGMWRSVNGGGTGYGAAIPGLEICGKTGTAQIVSKETQKRVPGVADDHAWFAGFSPRENPEIAVVVFIEHGGTGGVAAAPLARKIFKAFYDKKE